MKPKFNTLLARHYDVDEIEGKMATMARMPLSVTIPISMPIAESGYGKVFVNGRAISKGVVHQIDGSNYSMLFVPVGEVMNEYGKIYKVELKDFVAEGGCKFKNKIFNIKTSCKRLENKAYSAHDKVSLNAAREGMVLLQNNREVLPLKKTSTLNIFGKGQHMFRLSAWGAGKINPRWRPTFYQALNEHSSFTENSELKNVYGNCLDITPDKGVLLRAKEKSDIAIIIITRGSGEGIDNKPIKGEYYLSDEERNMIQSVCAVFEKKVVILNTGYPIDMRWIKEFNIDSVLYTGFAGMLAAYALMELLDGRTNPSGKLSDTWSFDYYDNPSSKNFINFAENDKIPTDREMCAKLFYEEDIYVGYRYFDTFDKDVAYCFGHGLSYSSFEIECAKCKFDGENIKLIVNVSNKGNCVGRETVQIYISCPEQLLEKPKRVLVGFEKSNLLEPGQSQKIEIEISKKTFASYYSKISSWILEEGEYALYCGNSLISSNKEYSFKLDECSIVAKSKTICAPLEPFNTLTKKDSLIAGMSSLLKCEEMFADKATRKEYSTVAYKKTSRTITYAKLKKNPELLNSFVAQMSDKELCRICVCGGYAWLPWQDGTAGRVVPIKKYKMPKFIASDGSTGVQINKPNIGMPSSTIVASTFNKDIAYNIGRIVAEESIENNIHLNLGPGMNIHRNILNGRHSEYFSEDPFLSGTMAGWHGKGIQDNGVSCCYKHLFANNSETVRKTSHSIVSERALREIYFKTFELAFYINKPDTIMTSYNALNGTYPPKDAELLQDLLRLEFGFEGFIMADWGSYDTVNHIDIINAGNSWLTPGALNNKIVNILINARKENKITRSVLESNVRYIIKVMLKRV